MVTCRCAGCGRDFYAEEPTGGLPDEIIGYQPIDDEEALLAAEEEVKREADEDGDHRYRPG